MRAKREERERARALRAEGRSVRTIAADLGVSQSSVSVWVRDVPVSAEQRAALDYRPKRPNPRAKVPQVLGSSGRRRTCSKCREDLPIEAFNRRGDDWQFYCRECFRVYFRDRGALHRRQSEEASLARQAATRQLLSDHLAAHPCADCGERDPVVLELDHLRDKRCAVSALMREGLVDLLEEELAKCEVACVNCHRRRTAVRAGWARAAGVLPRSYSGWQRIATLHVWWVLRQSGCVDCGEADLVVLEFDHQRDKVASPAWMAYHRRPVAEIDAEIAKCEVRCGNCHRRRTTLSLGWIRAAGAAYDGPASVAQSVRAADF